MKISNSKANAFNRCKKRYEFGYVMRLKRRAKVIHLERGTWLHTLLEVHYGEDPKKTIEVTLRTESEGRSHTRTRKVRVGTDWRKAHKLLTRQFSTLFEEERIELGNLPDECERIMLAYLSRYEKEEAKNVTIATELDEWVDLPNGDKFNFIIDRILQRPDGTVWLRDYKTVGTFMDESFKLLDTQLARYLWAFKRLPQFAHLASMLRGVEFDELRTKPPTIPEVTYAGTAREGLTQRANIDTDYDTYLSAIKAHGYKVSDYKDILTKLKAEPERFFRRTVLPKDGPVVKQMMLDLLVTAGDIKRHERTGRFPRTVLKSCKFDCDFLEVCIADLHGANIGPIVDLKYDIKERSEDGK